MSLPIYRKLGPAEIHLLKQFYREGWNTGQLARHFGVQRYSITAALRKRGIAIRPRHPKRAPDTPDGEGIRFRRDEAGCIVTVKHQASGKLFSFHEPGPGALEAACERIDRAGGDWKILSYSSPQTITRDLDGSRHRRAKTSDSPIVEGPEALALGQVGRLDLLDPSLHRDHARFYKRRGE